MTTHSFIITFNTESNEWYLDSGDMEFKYPNGNIWDGETWNYEYLGNGNYYPRAQEIGETITGLVEKLNN